MTKNQQTDITDLARQTQALFKLNGGIAPKLEHVVQTQHGIASGVASEVENFTQNWFQRRHDATQSTFVALQQITSAEKDNPAAAMQAVTEWQRGSFERLSADLQDWATLCMRCAGVATTASSEMASGFAEPDASKKTPGKAASGAGKGAAGKSDKTDGRDTSKSGSKGHATPV